MKNAHASRQKKATYMIGGFYVITAELWVDTQCSKIDRHRLVIAPSLFKADSRIVVGEFVHWISLM